MTSLKKPLLGTTAFLGLIFSAVPAHADPFSLPVSLAVPGTTATIQIADSKLAKPISAITDQTGTSYTELVYQINRVIQERVQFCADHGLEGWLEKEAHCDLIGFKPTRAAIAPSDQVLLPPWIGELKKEKLLVLEGATESPDHPRIRTFVIPIEYLLESIRDKRPIPWIQTNGDIHACDMAPFCKPHLDPIFD